MKETLAFYTFPVWWSILFAVGLRTTDQCFFKNGTHLYQAVAPGTLYGLMCTGYLVAFLCALANWHWFKSRGKGLLMLVLWSVIFMAFIMGTDMTQGALVSLLDTCAGRPVN